ncbi:FecR family protein [Leptothoe sp. PORK10 BA2]|uniref:FecR family protein n=1 Tax=Leptothoe sp. PORK10 BA2 TaxID=3110254 RepID=UPI002B21CA83|nr:FecR family protein [Leptothoe sp. PORK10 BA2]MEA5464314.1 FecR family protein [Leptothoe sp. PORK10 BA2]
MEKLNMAVTGRWLSLVCASLGMLVAMPRSASAESTLTWARVELTRNQVQVYSNGQSRRAQVSDMLGINDALSTSRQARAELRFNDGSLARIGESAVFRFTPNTRNFRLSNGTVLLLIPPGQGRTTIQTPNAVTGIHGSALFVRFVEQTNTTIIGALTNNPEGPMVAFNQDGSVQQPLYAGEMAVLRADGSLELFSFDLEQFYATSDLTAGLIENLDVATGDAAIDAVRQEIREALNQQEGFEDGDDVVENPTFLSANPNAPALSRTAVPDFSSSPAASFLQSPNLSGGFESAVSGSVNQSTTSQQPVGAVTPVNPPSPPSAVTPVNPPSPPVVQPTTPPTVEPEPPVKPVEPIPGPVGSTPEPVAPTPVAPPSEPVEPPVIPEPTIPEPVEPIVIKPDLPLESVIGEINLIEAAEPEVEAQIDRLPDSVMVQQEVEPAASTTPVGLAETTPGQP